VTCGGHVKVDKFERLSRYGQYEACGDQGVDLQLCVCDLKVNTTTSALASYLDIPSSVESYDYSTGKSLQPSSSTMYSIHAVIKDERKHLLPAFSLSVSLLLCSGECVYIFTRHHRFGSFLTLRNMCISQTFIIKSSASSKVNHSQLYWWGSQPLSRSQPLTLLSPGGVAAFALVLSTKDERLLGRPSNVKLQSCDKVSAKTNEHMLTIKMSVE